MNFTRRTQSRPAKSINQSVLTFVLHRTVWFQILIYCFQFIRKPRKGNIFKSKHVLLTSQKNFIDQHMPFLRLDKLEFIGTYNSYIPKKFHWPTHAIPASRHFEIRRNRYFSSPEKNHWLTQAFLTFRQIGIYRNMYFLRPEKFQRPTQAILTSRRIGIYRNM